MANKKYNYENVITNTSNNSKISRDLETAQEDLKKLYNAIKECEEYFHGKGEGSIIRKKYQECYDIIGKTGSKRYGDWATIEDTYNLVNNINIKAINDYEDYKEELRREEEERRRQEEERRRQEEEAKKKSSSTKQK